MDTLVSGDATCGAREEITRLVPNQTSRVHFVSTLFTNRKAAGELHRFHFSNNVFPGGASGTFVHAVIPVWMRSELLYGLAAQQAGVSGLCPERKS